MSEVFSAAVSVAERQIKEMIRLESRGNGDAENARKRLAKRYAIKDSLLWRLLYRKPHDLYTEQSARIEDAYVRELQRHTELLEQERKGIEAKSLAARNLVRAAAYLAGEKGELNSGE